MPRETAPLGRDSEEAMNRALQAEEQAREAIARCRTEAGVILDAAHAKARAIQARTDRRISRVHARCLLLAQDRVGELRAQEAQLQATDEMRAMQRQRFVEAVERLAVRLTGSEDLQQGT